MSQIATTLEQSKRLMAAGLDPKSCDMRWTNEVEKDEGWGFMITEEKEEYHLELGQPFSDFPSDPSIPAWSLSRLWDICNDSGIGPFNFGGNSIESSEIVAKLVEWIILGVHDYEVLDEYLNEETRQEQRHANDSTLSKELLK